MKFKINLDSKKFCRKVIPSRSKYSNLSERRCHNLKNHKGKCEELPFVDSLQTKHPRVAKKIERDSIMTTGAAWKSAEAGPNRILRWVMLENDKNLLQFGIDMSKLKPQVISKLREKAADYDSCICVAMWLTFQVYQMKNSPKLPENLKNYLEGMFGKLKKNSTVCTICKLPLSFKLFAKARRGKAAIETCHKNPRIHSPENVGFAHRECNIAQGSKTLEEFYTWIAGINKRAKSG